MESFYTFEAFASDPVDGDEILFYNWTLRPPSYATRVGNKPVDPVFYYYGKKVDIPAIDIYPAVHYSLTLTVTDSAGEHRSENFKFKVQKSHERDQFESKKGRRDIAINKWVSQWKSNILVVSLVLPAVTLLLKFLNNFMPDMFSLPFAKLILMILVKVILQTDPDEYSDESYIDVVKRIVYKPRLILKDINPEWWKKWFDRAELMLENIGFFKAAHILQLIEEVIGLDNNRPIISNPSPGHEETLVDLNTSKVHVLVRDPEGDPFSVHIFDENGYIDNTTGYYPMGQFNGSFNAKLKTPLPPNTQIDWNVLVIDQNNKNVTAEYKFTTHYE